MTDSRRPLQLPGQRDGDQAIYEVFFLEGHSVVIIILLIIGHGPWKK